MPRIGLDCGLMHEPHVGVTEKLHILSPHHIVNIVYQADSCAHIHFCDCGRVLFGTYIYTHTKIRLPFHHGLHFVFQAGLHSRLDYESNNLVFIVRYNSTLRSTPPPPPHPHSVVAPAH